MNNDAGESGYVSLSLLGIFVLLSAVAAGTSLWISAGRRALERETKRREESTLMDALTAKIIEVLSGDPTPGVNSADDPVWEYNGKDIDGFVVTVYPLSDRLNINFVRKNILEKTRLSLLFAPGRNAGDLQQFREDKGLSLFIDDYAPFFAVDDVGAFFSCYGWANINLIDEFAARKLGRSITGSEAAGEELRAVIQKLLLDQEICGADKLKNLFGFNYAKLFPWINAEALININFAEPALLREIIGYEAYGIDHVSSRMAEIASRRETGIKAEDIPVILGINSNREEHALTQYLGAVTWFWEILVAAKTPGGGERVRRTVVCRLPGTGSFEKPLYKIIEQRYQ
jgi:hypothetical protein